jgi:hypothetical protein
LPRCRPNPYQRSSEIARKAASTKGYKVLKFRLRIAGPCKRGSRGNCRSTYNETLMVLRLFRLCKLKTLPYPQAFQRVRAVDDSHARHLGKPSATNSRRASCRAKALHLKELRESFTSLHIAQKLHNPHGSASRVTFLGCSQRRPNHRTLAACPVVPPRLQLSSGS